MRGWKHGKGNDSEVRTEWKWWDRRANEGVEAWEVNEKWGIHWEGRNGDGEKGNEKSERKRNDGIEAGEGRNWMESEK